MKLDPEQQDSSNKESISNMEGRNQQGNQNGHRQGYQNQKPRTTSGNYGPPQQYQQAMPHVQQQGPPMGQFMGPAGMPTFAYPGYPPMGMMQPIMLQGVPGYGGQQMMQRMAVPQNQAVYSTSPGQQPFFQPQQNQGFMPQNFNPNVGYGGGPGPAYQMPTNQHQQGGAGPGVRHSVPTESAIGTSSVGETPVQMQPFRAPGPNAPLLRQTTPLVNFANVVPPSQQLAGSQATVAAPLVKRERKPLIIFNPETEKPVEIPAPIVAERRPSVVEGAAKAPPVSADTSTNSTDGEAKPRTDSVSDDKTVLDARAEFARQIASLSGKDAASGSSAEASASVSHEATPPPTARTSVNMVASDKHLSAGERSGSEITVRTSGEISSVPAEHITSKQQSEAVNQVVKHVEKISVSQEQSSQPTPAAPKAETVFLNPFDAAKSAPLPSKPVEREPSEEHQQSKPKELMARRPSVQEDSKTTPHPVTALVNGEDTPTDELEGLEQAAQEKPAGRLVYDRTFLLSLEASSKNVKPSPNLMKSLEGILKASQGHPQGNRGGDNQYSQYGPPPPGIQGGRPIPRVSSGRNIQQDQHQAPRVIKLELSSDFLAPQSSENAWKPTHKKNQVEVDEDEKTLATVRALLNKITPNNYDKLSGTMLTLPFTETAELLLGAVDVIFEKALDELNYAEIYAKLCRKLIDLETKEKDENGKTVKFRTVLLQRAQHYFEKTDKETQDADLEDKEISPSEAEEKRVKAKRHYLGNIRFISELYRFEMLTDRVILSCFQRLLPKKPDFSDADEEKLECLCKLLMTCSQSIRTDGPQGQQVQFFFDQLRKMIDSRATSSRIRFLMQDSIDLRNNNYVGRKNVVPANVKPKTLQEVHEEKRQEELAIKNAVKDLPPLPRGPQNMQGMQGGRGGPAGSQYPQRGGMQKVSSVPGSMNSLQSAQQGRGGDFGGGAKQIPTSGSAKMPSKFLNAMGGSSGQPFQLGGPKQWSQGSGKLPNPTGPGSGRYGALAPQRDSGRMENRSATSSRENSISRQGERDGPRGSLTNTPVMREGMPLVSEPLPSPGGTPLATPLSRSPVNEERPEVTDQQVQDLTKQMVEAIKKSEESEIPEVIADAVEKLAAFQMDQKTQSVSLVFGHYYEAKVLDRRPITVLLVGVAKEGRLPFDVLQASFEEQVAVTDDQIMDVGPSYYQYVVEIIGPMVIEGLFPVNLLDEVFRKSTEQHAEKYYSTFRRWLNLPANVSFERRQDLLGKESEWSKFFDDDSEFIREEMENSE